MQFLLESALIAVDAIWSNKLRSFMTVLGNIVAVTSIIAVVSLIQGLNATVKDAILSQAGADAFIVQRMPITNTDEEFEKNRYNPRMTMIDADAIKRYSPYVQAIYAEATFGGSNVSYRDKTLDDVQVRGVTPGYVEFGTFKVSSGRLINPIEVSRDSRVTVLGWQVADRLFGETDPLEKTIQIEGIHFRVVGVAEKKGSFFGNSQDEFAIVPLGVYQQMFGARQSLSVSVKPRDPSVLAAAMDDAMLALRIQRRLKPRQANNFGIFTSDTFLDLYHSATNGIFAVLLGVVGLSLVVGGIVIMNIMLMVVTERTREIGLRKALGAKRRDITWQILTESVVLSTFGGVVGTVLGFAVAKTIAGITPIPAAVEPWSVALGISITALVGLFFGLYPATRAARLDPIEALRRE